MIVIGYQGIGKSTLSQENNKYIDLESGSFWVNGKRHDDWYKIYCNIANHLSKQGYIVFVSSHEIVRNELKDSSEDVFVCYPSLELEYKWIAKLEERYKDSQLEKDYKALINAKDKYSKNIQGLMNSGFHQIIIEDMNYNLNALIEQYK